METIYSIGLILLVVILLYWGIKWLDKRNLIKKEDIERLYTSFEIAKQILVSMKISDKNKNTIKFVLDMADKAALFADQTLQSGSTDDKVKLALSSIDEALKALKINPSESEVKLINIVINESLNWIENQK
jgi:hypothetical protein